jgi:hypothetical protein
MRSRYDLPLTYTDGIVHGYVEFIKPPSAAVLVTGVLEQQQETFNGHPVTEIHKNYNKVVLQATTNGKTWSYALRPAFSATPGNLNWISHRAYVAESLRGSFRAHHNRANLENPYRDLVEWAVKDMARRARLPAGDAGALQIGVAYEREAPAEVGRKLQGPCGPITYTGYDARTGRYDIEDIHDIVVRAINACLPVWAWQGDRGPWKPSNLEVMLHGGKQAMGLAFAPGTGPTRNKRTISLNDILFRFYDDESIWRVIVHELCHHYRDEVFAPRDTDLATSERLRLSISAHVAKGSHIRQDTLNTHDSVFVRELARVDTKVDADPYAGICFNEYADPSLVADAKAAAEAKAAKRAAAVDWRPEAGRLWINRLKGGHFVVYWISLAEGGFKYKVGILNNTLIHQLIAKLGVGAGGETAPDMAKRVLGTAVSYSDTWPSLYWGTPVCLMDFIKLCEEKLGMFIWKEKP